MLVQNDIETLNEIFLRMAEETAKACPVHEGWRLASRLDEEKHYHDYLVHKLVGGEGMDERLDRISLLSQLNGWVRNRCGGRVTVPAVFSIAENQDKELELRAPQVLVEGGLAQAAMAMMSRETSSLGLIQRTLVI